nr:OB-fold domain-containing protein [Mesorhizobium sp.]
MTASRPLRRIGQYDLPYWDFAAKGELRVQACKSCGHLRYPPGPCCPRCLSEDTDWRKLSGRGRVVTWTIFHRAYFPEIPVPYTVVSVETEEGPLLIGNLVRAGDIQPAVGLAVTAVFEEFLFGAEPGRLCQWMPSEISTTDNPGEDT